jgi:hypothetical protein
MNTDMMVSTALSSMVGQTTGDAVSLSVLKKAMNIQAQGVSALINSVSQPQSAANLPPNLGQNINTTA